MPTAVNGVGASFEALLGCMAGKQGRTFERRIFRPFRMAREDLSINSTFLFELIDCGGDSGYPIEGLTYFLLGVVPRTAPRAQTEGVGVWSMVRLLRLLCGALIGLLRSKARREAEILVLRHQVNVLRRKSPSRPALSNVDRLLFFFAISAATDDT